METTATCTYDGDKFWDITQYRKYKLTVQVDEENVPKLYTNDLYLYNVRIIK